jgi:hypothetical protein
MLYKTYISIVYCFLNDLVLNLCVWYGVELSNLYSNDFKGYGELIALYSAVHSFKDGFDSLSNNRSVNAQTNASRRSGDLLELPGT